MFTRGYFPLLHHPEGIAKSEGEHILSSHLHGNNTPLHQTLTNAVNDPRLLPGGGEAPKKIK